MCKTPFELPLLVPTDTQELNNLLFMIDNKLLSFRRDILKGQRHENSLSFYLVKCLRFLRSSIKELRCFKNSVETHLYNLTFGHLYSKYELFKSITPMHGFPRMPYLSPYCSSARYWRTAYRSSEITETGTVRRGVTYTALSLCFVPHGNMLFAKGLQKCKTSSRTN